jgi:hypothetical protein
MCIQVMYELYQLRQPDQLIFSSIFTNQHTWVRTPNDTPNDAPNDKPELYMNETFSFHNKNCNGWT